MEFDVRDDPDPVELDCIDTEVRASAAAATGIDDEHDLAVLVREDGQLRAGVYGWTWGDSCELQSLWVDPALRGNGLGLQLLTMAEEEARNRGCRQVVIFVQDFQPIALYERFGFRTVARIPEFPAGSTAIWMRKPIK
jgi:ribosomal protein S18 acetylase RimI-like enzyme